MAGPGETTAFSRRARRKRDASIAPFAAGDRNEAALLEAARALLLSGEFRSTPIREIAKAAGISRQGFYFYFKSKEELAAELVTETLYRSQTWRATFYDDDRPSPADAVRRVMTASVYGWRDNHVVLGAAIEMAARAPVITEHWIAVAEEAADFLVDLVVAETKIDAMRDRDAASRTIVSVIWALERNCYMHFVRRTDDGADSDEALADRLTRILCAAVGFD
jgi:AcrR family transcriptional regulator